MNQSVYLSNVTVTASGTGRSRTYTLSAGPTNTVGLIPDTRSVSFFKASTTGPVVAWCSDRKVSFEVSPSHRSLSSS